MKEMNNKKKEEEDEEMDKQSKKGKLYGDPIADIQW